MHDEIRSPGISIVTATLNAIEFLPRLVASLDSQASRDFEWIVMDGGSTDGTVRMLEDFGRDRPWIRFFTEPDFGFYDALNKAIRRAATPFYVVVGADDLLAVDAVQNYLRGIETGQADVLLADVMIDGRRRGGYFPRRGWLGHPQMFK